MPACKKETSPIDIAIIRKNPYTRKSSPPPPFISPPSQPPSNQKSHLYTIPNPNPTFHKFPNPTQPNPIHPTLFLPQTSSHIRPAPPPELLCVLAPQARRLDVGGALVVGPAEHADDAQEDGLGRLDGGPALAGGLVAVGVGGGGVQDGDADVAGWVDWVLCWHTVFCFCFCFCFLERVWGFEEGGGGGGRVYICTIPFGWKMGVWKVILGGRWGYSGGKMRWAR